MRAAAWTELEITAGRQAAGAMANFLVELAVPGPDLKSIERGQEWVSAIAAHHGTET